MKLKAVKAHYWDGEYKAIGSVYITDIVRGASLVKRGNCVEVELPKRPPKRELPKRNKQHPKTKKGAIKIK